MRPDPNPEKSKIEEENSNPNAYLKYAGIAFQFFALIFIAALGGQKLDQWLHMDPPLFTVFLIMLFAVAYFIKLYYELFK